MSARTSGSAWPRPTPCSMALKKEEGTSTVDARRSVPDGVPLCSVDAVELESAGTAKVEAKVADCLLVGDSVEHKFD